MDKVGFKVYQVIKSRRPIIKGSIAVYFHAVCINKKVPSKKLLRTFSL